LTARRHGEGALLWAADAWLAPALAPRLAAADCPVAVVSPAVDEERRGEFWEIPAPAPGEIDAALASVFDAFGSCHTAVVETRLLDGASDEAGDWEAGLGQRLWRSFAAARAAATYMAARGGGAIFLLGVDRDGDTPWPEADVCRAAVVTMAHGLAKAAPRGVRIAAVLSGPADEARPSGQRTRSMMSAPTVAEGLMSLLRNTTWASGSVFLLDRD